MLCCLLLLVLVFMQRRDLEQQKYQHHQNLSDMAGIVKNQAIELHATKNLLNQAIHVVNHHSNTHIQVQQDQNVMRNGLQKCEERVCVQSEDLKECLMLIRKSEPKKNSEAS